MVFVSKFSVGLPNFLLAGLAAHAEQFVIILFGCSWHSCDSLAESEGRYAELKASPSARLVPTIRIARATALRGAGAAKSCRADRKSTRLNSSHVKISYAVFCLKKKKKNH